MGIDKICKDETISILAYYVMVMLNNKYVGMQTEKYRGEYMP